MVRFKVVARSVLRYCTAANAFQHLVFRASRAMRHFSTPARLCDLLVLRELRQVLGVARRWTFSRHGAANGGLLGLRADSSPLQPHCFTTQAWARMAGERVGGAVGNLGGVANGHACSRSCATDRRVRLRQVPAGLGAANTAVQWARLAGGEALGWPRQFVPLRCRLHLLPLLSLAPSNNSPCALYGLTTARVISAPMAPNSHCTEHQPRCLRQHQTDHGRLLPRPPGTLQAPTVIASSYTNKVDQTPAVQSRRQVTVLYLSSHPPLVPMPGPLLSSRSTALPCAGILPSFP